MPTEELHYISPYNKCDAVLALRRLLVRGNPHGAVKRLQDECVEIFNELGVVEIGHLTLGVKNDKYSATFIYNDRSGRGFPSDETLELPDLKYDSGIDQFFEVCGSDGLDALVYVTGVIGKRLEELGVKV